ncbi:MAG: MMPL family transporter [Candidatus Nanohaloarchaeota archaeon]|nr:MMPL family transporter [Candidatus Nanohaloarchaeota archaeon]
MRKDIKLLLKDPRIIIAFVALLIAIIAIRPMPVKAEDGSFNLKTNIKKGIDLAGGIEALIELEEPTLENAQAVIQVLSQRISSFGLKEADFSILSIDGKYYVKLTLAEANESDLKDIIESEGVFEARIEREATDVFVLNGKKYEIKDLNESCVLVGNYTLCVNGSAVIIDDIPVIYKGKKEEVHYFDLIVFTGSDIVSIRKDVNSERIIRTEGGYQFSFGVIITQEAAEKFAKVTKDMKVVVQGTNQYLDKPLNLYLDGKLISNLSIVASLKGRAVTEPVITGYGKTLEEAKKEMFKLESILMSGRLPTKIKIVEINIISPTLGKDFLNRSIYAIIIAIIVISLVVYIRYREKIFVIPMILTSISEAILILGFAALVGWTIDLAAIAGIVAAIGTGIDDQIVVLDESKRKKVKESIKLKLKRAFFIIFTSAFTTIAAMLPLLFSSFANVKGFAFTTIVGVLIGVFITRPAFSKVVEFFKD